MHSAVLLCYVIEVLSVIHDVVGRENFLEELESVVVGMSKSRSVVEDSDVGIDHLIISDHEKGRVVNGSFGVSSGDGGGLGEGREVGLNEVDELGVRNVSGTDNDDVLSKVVVRMEVLDVLRSEVVEIIDVSSSGLSHHMVSEDVEVDVLEGGSLVFGVSVLLDVSHLFSGHLESGGVDIIVRDDVSEDFDGLRNVVLEDLDCVMSNFSLSSGSVFSAHSLELRLELGSRSVLSSLKSEFLEEESRSGCGKVLVSGSSLDEDSDSSESRVRRLGGNGDSVGSSCLVVSSDGLEGLGDLSELKLSEVLHDGGLGELKGLRLGLDGVVLGSGNLGRHGSSGVENDTLGKD